MNLVLTILCLCSVNISATTRWNPQVLNGIKWTAPNQDVLTLQYLKANGVLRLPIKYYGGVDSNADGEIDEGDIDSFRKWVEINIPSAYTGPLVMDYEKPWWEELRGATITHQRLNELMTPYVKGLLVAKKSRPKLSWGYYGIPTRRNTSSKWLEQGNSLEPIFKESGALFPAIYDCSRGNDRTKEVGNQIATSLKQAAGRIPVYAFMSPRYCGESGDRSLFVPDDIFLRQANAALRASWTDAEGRQHRIKGLILWDAFGYTPEKDWQSLDEKHKHYFELLIAITKAWSDSMKDVEIIVSPEQYIHKDQGLPEPENSSEFIEKPLDGRTKDTSKQDERVPSERVPDGRVPR